MGNKRKEQPEQYLSEGGKLNQLAAKTKFICDITLNRKGVKEVFDLGCKKQWEM